MSFFWSGISLLKEAIEAYGHPFVKLGIGVSSAGAAAVIGAYAVAKTGNSRVFVMGNAGVV